MRKLSIYLSSLSLSHTHTHPYQQLSRDLSHCAVVLGPYLRPSPVFADHSPGPRVPPPHLHLHVHHSRWSAAGALRTLVDLLTVPALYHSNGDCGWTHHCTCGWSEEPLGIVELLLITYSSQCDMSCWAALRWFESLRNEEAAVTFVDDISSVVTGYCDSL